MSRVRVQTKNAAYWWNDNIAQLRKIAIRANRELARSRRAGDTDRIDRAWQERKVARKNLALAIKIAKTEAWEEALQELNNDPWGRPYKMVMDKLRPKTASITQAMEPAFLQKVLRTLFPTGEDEEMEPDQQDETPAWNEEDNVTKWKLGWP